MRWQRIQILKWMITIIFVCALSGCERKASFQNTDITGLSYGKNFSLTDHNGRARTLADFKGKAVFLFFGYTQCPDVCPTTLSELANVMKMLGADAERVQVLFVTVDPERDTQTLLAHYMPVFDARFLGLRGNAIETEKVAQEFKVVYQKIAGKTPQSYTMDHTAGSFVFDPNGRLRLYVRYGQTIEAITHDLKILLHE